MNSKKAQRSSYLMSIGFPPSDVDIWQTKWMALKNRTYSGVGCSLTFEDYVSLAKQAGLTSPDQIGLSSYQYHMARYGDKGSYSLDNCRFIPVRQNQLERIMNGGTQSVKDKLSSRNKHNDANVARVSNKISKDFRLVAPDGSVHFGRNLKEFCKENNIPYGNMSMVCNGKLVHTKGWTGSYVGAD